MNIISVRNVHRALPLALELMRTQGVRRSSRYGDVFQMVGSVTTSYSRPTERVMFWEERDANPFFHFAESYLWMLGGCNDVETVARFAAHVATFSDDGKIFHGAYGHRWRVGMPTGVHGTEIQDQIKIICDLLRNDKNDRRCVLQMWDSASDLGRSGKDVPCNTMATLQIGTDGRLDLSVFCRSNDIVWGCYGANAVQFSVMQEYVAACVGVPVGIYEQISVNWHGYEKTYSPLLDAMLDTSKRVRGESYLDLQIKEECPYTREIVRPYPIMWPGTNPVAWEESLQKLLKHKGRAPNDGRWHDPFFPEVAIPILKAHDAFRELTGERRYQQALHELRQCRATDWKMACGDWILRRLAKFQKKEST